MNNISAGLVESNGGSLLPGLWLISRTDYNHLRSTSVGRPLLFTNV